MCVDRDSMAELPWLSAMVAFPWTAYGVSQTFYYKKSQAENTEGGITYENMRQQFINEFGSEGVG